MIKQFKQKVKISYIIGRYYGTEEVSYTNSVRKKKKRKGGGKKGSVDEQDSSFILIMRFHIHHQSLPSTTDSQVKQLASRGCSNVSLGDSSPS